MGSYLLNRAEQPAILAGRGCSGLGPLYSTSPPTGKRDHPDHAGQRVSRRPSPRPRGLGPGGSEASTGCSPKPTCSSCGRDRWPELYLPDQLSIVRSMPSLKRLAGRSRSRTALLATLWSCSPLQEGSIKRKPHWQRRLQEWKADWQASSHPNTKPLDRRFHRDE